MKMKETRRQIQKEQRKKREGMWKDEAKKETRR